MYSLLNMTIVTRKYKLLCLTTVADPHYLQKTSLTFHTLGVIRRYPPISRLWSPDRKKPVSIHFPWRRCKCIKDLKNICNTKGTSLPSPVFLWGVFFAACKSLVGYLLGLISLSHFLICRFPPLNTPVPRLKYSVTLGGSLGCVWRVGDFFMWYLSVIGRLIVFFYSWGLSGALCLDLIYVCSGYCAHEFVEWILG